MQACIDSQNYPVYYHLEVVPPLSTLPNQEIYFEDDLVEGSQKDYAIKPKRCTAPYVCKPTLTPVLFSPSVSASTSVSASVAGPISRSSFLKKKTQKFGSGKMKRNEVMEMEKYKIEDYQREHNLTTTTILDMYIFHPKEYYNISGQNTADVLGDVLFICGDFLSNHTR